MTHRDRVKAGQASGEARRFKRFAQVEQRITALLPVVQESLSPHEWRLVKAAVMRAYAVGREDGRWAANKARRHAA